MLICDAFIDGKWVTKDAKFDVYGRCITYELYTDQDSLKLHFIEPSTNTVLGHVANCSLEDFQKSIESASNAQPLFFESTTGTSRGALLRRWNDLILANADDRT